MNRVPTPSSARFLMISLPRAPAPITRTRARRSRAWSHQPMRRKRWNRSSCAAEASAAVIRTVGSLMMLLRGAALRSAGRDLRLQPEDVPVLAPDAGKGLVVEELFAGLPVVELVAQ